MASHLAQGAVPFAFAAKAHKAVALGAAGDWVCDHLHQGLGFRIQGMGLTLKTGLWGSWQRLQALQVCNVLDRGTA